MDDQMGRHKDYRAPKRRGCDDDNAPDDRVAGGRLNGPKPSAPQGWQSIDAVVKWFNPEKGLRFCGCGRRIRCFPSRPFLGGCRKEQLACGRSRQSANRPRAKGPQVSAVIE